MGWGSQPLTLAFNCRKRKTVLHELGHTIGEWDINSTIIHSLDFRIIHEQTIFFPGLLHEQNRPDRDNYVKIKKENIVPKAFLNFKKYSSSEIDYRGENYDFHSIMHYGPRLWTMNGLVTIEPKNKDMIAVMGWATEVCTYAIFLLKDWMMTGDWKCCKC